MIKYLQYFASPLTLFLAIYFCLQGTYFPTLFFIGFSLLIIFGDMSLIQELHKPDIGIVPIGDRFTMGGAVAALACRRYFKFKNI